MPQKRPIFRYAVLGFLFAITLVYEIRFTKDIYRDEKIDIPFFYPAEGSNVIQLLRPEAIHAGIHRGDILLAVNGVPYTGTAVLGSALAHAQPGTPIALTLASGETGGGTQRTVMLPVDTAWITFWDITGDLVFYLLLPGLSLLLGFWVAFARPHDSMAWLLLALMLTFPHLFESYKVAGWEPGWREFGMIYHATLGAAFPIIMYLFGRYFPEHFPKGSKFELIWNIQQWIFAIPFAILALVSVIIFVGQLSNYHSVAPLADFLKPFDRFGNFLPYLLIASFFAALGIKTGISRSPDAKRRLRLLYWGTTLSFAPGLSFTIFAHVLGKSPVGSYPQWLIIVVLLPLILFPITLAYVIVVQKAMDVRVAVRMGLQYALARNGVHVLQALAIAAVVVTALSMAGDVNRNRPQKITVIALGVTAAFSIRRLGTRLRTWVDRRFFREAYNAEQVLTELSDQVRSMIEPSSLLQTVADRISATLHVPQVAVLLGAGEWYKPALAVGCGDLSGVMFASSGGTAKLLQQQKEPARVFLSDRDSWLYREEDVSQTERDKLAVLRAELLLPLAARDKLLGFVCLGPKRSEEPYTGSDVRLLKSVAAQTGLALENATLMRQIADEVAQRERLNREVEIAREVQERLFPQKLPEVVGLDYAGYCRPALGVGGDYYDFLALPGGQLGVAIGDVSGKGIAAALMMASLQASLRGEAARGATNLAAVVSNVNRLVFEASSANRYATFFYGQYDPQSRIFDYVNAGHNPPMLFRCSNGKWIVKRLDVGGTVVGLLENFPYEQGSISLCSGDILVAYTDGISEAMTSADEEWGEARLEETVECCTGFSAQEILQHIFTAVDEFVADAPQHDDMTLAVLRTVS